MYVVLCVGEEGGVLYMFSPCGLFPAPLGRHVKSATLTKIKSKFKLLGKLMAKAVMDSRMVSTDPHLQLTVVIDYFGKKLQSKEY